MDRPLSDKELDAIKARMDARPDLLIDPVIVNRLIVTLDAKIVEIEELRNGHDQRRA